MGFMVNGTFYKQRVAHVVQAARCAPGPLSHVSAHAQLQGRTHCITRTLLRHQEAPGSSL